MYIFCVFNKSRYKLNSWYIAYIIILKIFPTFDDLYNLHNKRNVQIKLKKKTPKFVEHKKCTKNKMEWKMCSSKGCIKSRENGHNGKRECISEMEWIY